MPNSNAPLEDLPPEIWRHLLSFLKLETTTSSIYLIASAYFAGAWSKRVSAM
jgi:hypothetical protein